MFKSQLSGKQYGPGIKPERVVTKTRERTYHNEYRDREGIKQYVTSQGWEIVSEMVVGPDEVPSHTEDKEWGLPTGFPVRGAEG